MPDTRIFSLYIKYLCKGTDRSENDFTVESIYQKYIVAKKLPIKFTL